MKKFWKALLLMSMPALSASASDIRALNILSDSWSLDSLAIVRGAADGVNQVQLSHDLMMNLFEVRDSSRMATVRRLADLSHDSGIPEVCVWDHALYDTDYYPSEFRYPGTGLLDLDRTGLWEWMADDYRDMLSQCPFVDGVVLTFIESGARVEEQFSTMSVPERLAKVVGTVSEVVCGEFGKKLWLRTFAYTPEEYEAIIECFGLIEWHDGMGLMVKDAPHDFFITHPVNQYIGRLGHPTLVEFDACGEYSGQGVILNTLPDFFASRWNAVKDFEDVTGWVARTSRKGDSEITGTPSEVNIYALMHSDSDDILGEYLTERYGRRAARRLRPIFEASRAVLDGTMYLMNLSTTHHSEFCLTDESTYWKHVSGRWTDRDSVYLAHGLDREFHWWNDLVASMSPDGEMDAEFLDCLARWTDDCTSTARKSFRKLWRCRRFLSHEDYVQLRDLCDRSLMCLELRGNAAVCHYGVKVWNGNQSHALRRMLVRRFWALQNAIDRYDSYSRQYPAGTWDWQGDTIIAARYMAEIKELIL